MRVLLDTQVWLWAQAFPERLNDRAAEILRDPNADRLLSAVSSLEIAIKFALGRLELPEPPTRYVPSRMRLGAVSALAVEHAHALRVSELPNHHRDPFDRLLVAQAQLERLPVLTADRQFAAYDVEVLPAG